MSKYDKLWEYVEEQEGDELVLTFDEIGAIAGVPLDHSFLNYKKEPAPWLGSGQDIHETANRALQATGGIRLSK